MTGLGAVSPYGIGVARLWEGLSTGTNAMGYIREFRTDDLCCQVGACLPPFDPRDYIDRKLLVGLDIFEIIAVIAAREALDDAVSDPAGKRLSSCGGGRVVHRRPDHRV